MDTKTYGSFWLRLIAYLFDSLLIWLIPVAWFLYLVFSVVDISAFGMGILWLSWYLVIGQWFTWQLYPLITLILFGGSIGKRMAVANMKTQRRVIPIHHSHVACRFGDIAVFNS